MTHNSYLKKWSDAKALKMSMKTDWKALEFVPKIGVNVDANAKFGKTMEQNEYVESFDTTCRLIGRNKDSVEEPACTL